ncbi:MAG: tRNA preQ1(34) S-adenosylmethionine ribosyltransferase-isomerase QueA [Candidatus Omnitrophica bacterium]|nr:tRNA preQ1(34) S-adenosylmethionine ribosyltransferase-isomerase QueA [Candidatus Omnitrophota bacterium]
MNFKNQKSSKTASQSILDIFRLQSYFYQLPDELIAQEPVAKRDSARLLVINRAQEKIVHDTFNHLNDYLPCNSHLIVNNSKVIPARLLGHRSSGGTVEIFLLNSLEDGYSFEVLLRPLKKIREGETIDLGLGINATLENKEKRIVRFNKRNIIRHLKEVGHIPLPPYIKRPDIPRDREDYQTVYAKQPGSVASPTAGLHFTKGLIKNLKAQGHRFFELTLHINYGTFKPVECDDIRLHPMHTEHYSIKPAVYKSILKAKKDSKKIVAVGTTSCRVLESSAHSKVYAGSTDMFIFPGYKFQMVDALITNFHLPYSTLLMLVCAFGGYDLVMQAYQEAIKERYRFYSYGDGMLII